MEDIECYDEENYNEFEKYLISIQDFEYTEFHSSLVLNSKYEMIGIRVPIMHDIAKKIAKGNIEIRPSKFGKSFYIDRDGVEEIQDEIIKYIKNKCNEKSNGNKSSSNSQKIIEKSSET